MGRADGDTWLRLGDAAAALGVSLNTLRRWSDSGKLTCYRSSGGHRRYRRRDVELALIAQESRRPDVSDHVSSQQVHAASARAALGAIARATAEGLGVTSCLIAATKGDELVVLADYSVRPGRRYASPGETVPLLEAPVAAEVARTGRRVVLPDLAHTTVLSEADAAAYRSFGDRAILAQPLRVGSRVFGVLEIVESRAPRTFTGPNTAFAEFMSRQAASIIEQDHADRGRRATRTNERFWHRDRTVLPVSERLLDYDDADVPAPHEPPPVASEALRAIAHHAARAIGATGCDVLVLVEDGRELEVLIASGGDPHARAEGQRYLLEQLTESEAAVLGAGLLPADGMPTRASRSTPVATQRREHGGSVLSVPAALGAKTLGALQIFAAHPGRVFSEDEIDLVSSLGTLAALAIDGADAHRRLTAHATGFGDVLAGALSLSRAAGIEGLLADTARRVAQGGSAAFCAIHRLHGDTATTVVSWERGSTTRGEGTFALPECPAAAAAVAERRPNAADGLARLDPASSSWALRNGEHGLARTLFVPIIAGADVVGLLELGGGADDPPPQASDDILFAADTIAAVLATTDWASHEERRNRDLSLVVEAGLKDSALLSTDEVLHSVAQRLAELTKSPVVDIYAVEGDTLRALVSYDGQAFDADWEGVTVPLARYPCSKLAVETADFAVAASLDDPILTPEGRYSLEKWGYQSQASVPLVARGHVIGIAELSDYVPRDFADDLGLILGLAQVAANALENASLFEQVEHRSAILRELVDLGTVTARAHDAEGVLAAAADRLLKTVDGANCDIFRIEGNLLRCLASFDRSGYDERPISNVLDLGNYPATAAAIAARETLVLPRPDDPRLSEHERRVFRDFGFGSEVCVPLIVNDEVFGLIDISDTRPRDYADHLDFLKTAAQLVAAALENLLLLEQLESRTTVLRELVELGGLCAQIHDLDDLLTTIATRLRETIGVADCDVFVLEGDTLRCRASVDNAGIDAGEVGRLVPLDDYPATALAIADRELLVVNDRNDPRLTAEERCDFLDHGYHSELAIPLVAGDRVIGLIDVFDTRERDYGEYADFIRSVGQMVAGVVENALLLTELGARNDELRELVELGGAVSEHSDVDRLARAVVQRVTAVTGATGCQIFSLQQETLRCLMTYENGVFDPDFVGRPFDLALFPSTAAAMERRVPLIITSPHDPRLSGHERRLYTESGSRSELSVPLVVGNEIVGLLEVFDRQPRDYAECLHFVVSAGQVVAGALANALLAERLEDGNRRLSVLVDSSLEFGATLDLDEVLVTVARRMGEVAGAPCCDISAYKDDVLSGLVSVTGDGVSTTYTGTTYALADLHFAALAVRERVPSICHDCLDDKCTTAFERREWSRFGFRAAVQLPLINHGEVIGLVSIFDDHVRHFEHLDLLQGLAQIAANALANATLYRRLDESAGRLSLVNELGVEFASSLDPREVLITTARRLCNVIDVPSCDVYTTIGEDRLRCIASISEGELDTAWMESDVSLSNWGAVSAAMAGRGPVAISSLSDPRLTELEREAMRAQREKSALAMPLVSRGRVIGAVELLETRTERRWTEQEIALVAAICRVAALAIDNARLYEDIKGMHLSNLKALSSALNAKDYYTLGHAARVSAYMVLLGEELGWPPELMQQVEEAAYLHDIGKIGVSDRILLKPSNLNALEWETMRLHPIFSADIIRPLFAEELALGVRHHHERYDGAGYPDGLAGEAIPRIARAMCVVDSYDAMSFRRPYRLARTYRQCLTELETCAGKHFDPAVVTAFVRVLERVEARHRQAEDVARQGAAHIDLAKHACLRTHADETRPEYAELVAALRRVRDANPPTRFLTTQRQADNRFVIIVDAEETESCRARIGDQVLADDGLLEAFSGAMLESNVLSVDEFGVWISGVAQVLDEAGEVACVVSADLPASVGGIELDGLRSDVSEAFASLLRSAASRVNRVELDGIVDGLTGLSNHRYLHERLSEEVERAHEQGASVALIFCDIDDFKAFNDAYGHSAGDAALRGAAHVIEESLRHVDIAARYAGQQFAALVIDTEAAGACEVGERIRRGLAEAILVPGTRPLTVSIGVAACPGDGRSRAELIDKAEWATALAKRAGGDRVVSFSEGHTGGSREGTPTLAPLLARLLLAHEAFARARAAVMTQVENGAPVEAGLGPEELAWVRRALDADGGGGQPAEALVALLGNAPKNEEGPGARPAGLQDRPV